GSGPVAKPSGVDSTVGRLVYNFNLLGYPEGETYQGDCGNGHRIFVNRGANHARINVVDTNDGWYIADCNATSDHSAELHTDTVGQYAVYVRILGAPGGHLHICADSLTDFQTGEQLCLLGTIDLTRNSGRSSFTIAPSTMFDASLEEIV